MMEGFSAGVNPGGLYAQRDIEVLICYMLRDVGEPIPQKVLLEVISGNGMANYFETTAALEELEKRGHVLESEDGYLSLADTGAEIATTLERTIPFVLRERSVNLALKMLLRIRREQETKVTVEQLRQGCLITCTTLDGDLPSMSVALRVADKMQADMIKEQFLNDPPLLYRCILSILTNDARMERNDTRLVIDLE